MLIINDLKRLKQECIDVLPEEVDDLIKKLEDELDKINKSGANGIGLAAPQIGIFKKIAIIRLPDQKLNLVNCTIDKAYHQILFKDEGCLSFPGQNINTLRYKEIYVKNNLVEPKSFIATDFLAVACQHEIDHFSQKLMFDRQTKPTVINKQKPNEPCACGKIDEITKKVKKYKKCCGK